MTRAEIKTKARQTLKGNWAYAILIMIVFSLVTSLVSSLGVAIAELILIGPLTVGLVITFIHASRQGKFELNDLFAGFKDSLGERILLGLLKSIFIMLWSLLFIIPGIVKSFSYAAAETISAEHPEYTWKQCIDESRRLMHGHKGDLFVLQLSFIGWALLCCLTFGIGFLWLMPYMQASSTEFMLDLISHDAILSSHIQGPVVVEANIVR